MNFDERIATLRDKGLLSREQAERLKNSLKPPSPEPFLDRRKWTPEILGILLITVFGLGLGLSATAVMEPVGSPQNVAKSLNAPVSSGLSPGGTAWIVIGGIALGLYLLFYLLARRGYRRLWNSYLVQRALAHRLDALKATTIELTEHLEKLRENPTKNVADNRLIISESDDDALRFVMESLKEFTQMQTKLRQELEEAKARYTATRMSLSGALAAYMGELPNEEE